MAAPRRSRAGLAAGAGALALTAALAAYPAAGTGAAAPLVAVPGGVALLVLAVALAFRLAVLLPLTLLLLVGEYAVFLVLEDGGHRGAPLVAAALVLLAELGYWGVEPRGVGRAPGVALRRLALVLGLGVGAAAVAGFLLGAAGVVRGGGVLLPAVGVAAVVATLALLAVLARPRPAG